MIKNAIANWKTTTLGLSLIGGAIIHLVFTIRSGQNNELLWSGTLGAILAGFGLIVAGDAGKSTGLVDALSRIDALEKQLQDSTAQQTPPKPNE